MYQGNIKFLIIMGILLFSAITFFVWSCRNSISEYEKIVKKGGE